MNINKTIIIYQSHSDHQTLVEQLLALIVSQDLNASMKYIVSSTGIETRGEPTQPMLLLDLPGTVNDPAVLQDGLISFHGLNEL